MIRLSRKVWLVSRIHSHPGGAEAQDTEDHVATHRKATPLTLRKCWGPHGERPQAVEALTLCMTSREVATFPFPHSCPRTISTHTGTATSASCSPLLSPFQLTHSAFVQSIPCKVHALPLLPTHWNPWMTPTSPRFSRNVSGATLPCTFSSSQAPSGNVPECGIPGVL